MNYELVDNDPYSQVPLKGPGLLIKEKWDKEYLKLIRKKKVDCLFLNHARGWSCDDYSFLSELDIQLLHIIDTHDRGIDAIESLGRLKSLSLNLPNKTRVDFKRLADLTYCFTYWSKYTESILEAKSLVSLYLDGFKVKGSPDFSELNQLKELTLGNSNIESLSFLSHLPDLQRLELLNCKKIKDFLPVGHLKELRRLNIDGYRDIGSLAFLSTCTELEVLLLNVGKIRNIEVLKNLRKLKALSFNGPFTVVEDGNLKVLTSLPLLAMLMIQNRKHYTHKLIKPWSWKNFDLPDVLLQEK